MPQEISIAFQTNKRAGEYIALAKQVNAYDFDAVTVYCDAPFHPSYGPLMLMAPHVTRARLGPAAIPPFRMHPLDIAANTALLADLALGGVYVGIARGAWLADHGIREIQPAVTAVRESVEVVRYFLEGRTGGYQGSVYQIAEHVRAAFPVPEKRIPILIGSWGRKLCAAAGEIADEVKIGGSANPDVIPVIRSYITEGEMRAGRAPGTVGICVGAVCVIDEDREQARAAARRSVALYLPVVAPLDPTVNVEPAFITRLQDLANRQAYGESAALISDDLLDRFAFSGDFRDIIRQSEALFDAGAARVEFGTPHGLVYPEVGIRLLGEKVIPALRR